MTVDQVNQAIRELSCRIRDDFVLKKLINWNHDANAFVYVPYRIVGFELLKELMSEIWGIEDGKIGDNQTEQLEGLVEGSEQILSWVRFINNFGANSNY